MVDGPEAALITRRPLPAGTSRERPHHAVRAHDSYVPTWCCTIALLQPNLPEMYASVRSSREWLQIWSVSPNSINSPARVSAFMNAAGAYAPAMP